MIAFLNKRKNLYFALLFGAFMFLQLVILRMGNAAGRGFLPDAQQVYVYFFLQFAVIIGYMLHLPVRKHLRDTAGYPRVVCCTLGACLLCAMLLLFAPADSAFYLAVTSVCALFLGVLSGAVYLRMADLGAEGAKVGRSVGLGYSCAIALQYAVQLRWTLKIPLAVLIALAAACLCVLFAAPYRADAAPVKPNAHAASGKKCGSAVVITLAMLIFTSYFNTYIHHLQVASGYTEYNVYTWPRLLMIPAMILLGLIGDVKGGKLLPTGTLCVVVVALLNTALRGSETNQLNMCLFYLAMAAVVAYYHLTFLRIAPETRRPALWAGMGRILDSVSVILSFGVNLEKFSAAAVLALDVAALAVVIVVMALSGAFGFSASDTLPVPPREASAQTDPFAAIQERYGLTPAELNVFRELVLTEDKQAAIGDRLSIKLRTVQANVTAIYGKTGVSTRAGLVQLYNESK